MSTYTYKLFVGKFFMPNEGNLFLGRDKIGGEYSFHQMFQPVLLIETSAIEYTHTSTKWPVPAVMNGLRMFENKYKRAIIPISSIKKHNIIFMGRI